MVDELGVVTAEHQRWIQTSRRMVDLLGVARVERQRSTQTRRTTREEYILRTGRMVLGVMLAVLAFVLQSVTSPPGGVWQQGDTGIYKAGHAVIGSTHPYLFNFWALTNSVAFSLAALVIALVVSGSETKTKFSIRTYWCAVCGSLMAVIANYVVSTVAISPSVSKIWCTLVPIAAVFVFMTCVQVFHSGGIFSPLNAADQGAWTPEGDDEATWRVNMPMTAEGQAAAPEGAWAWAWPAWFTVPLLSPSLPSFSELRRRAFLFFNGGQNRDGRIEI